MINRFTPLARAVAYAAISFLVVTPACRLFAESPHGPTVPAPRQAATHSQITGSVQDPTTAIISGAKVQLRQKSDSTLVTETTTDADGHFKLSSPPPGDYVLMVTLAGFSPVTRQMHVTASSALPPPMALTMDLASVATDVTVNANDNSPLSTDTNADSTSMDAGDMANLPIFDADIVATLQAFLDAGAAGEGGTTLMIDGVESKTVGVSPSAIERVSVNQDPYSAQYRSPGRGQVEIVTKPATDRFHGAFTFTFRDAALEAKNYFSTVKPPSQRRIYEGFVSGPTGEKHTSFLFSFTRREQDSFAQVIAIPALNVAATNVAAPTRNTSLTMKVQHQYNDHHSGYLLYRFYDASVINPNIGGQTIQSAGYNNYNFDMDVTYHDDLTIGANKFNQFSLLFERNLDRTASAVPNAFQVAIQGVATLGSAQSDVFNTENNPNVSEIFNWTLSTHMPQQLKFGIQMPNLGRRILEDRTNRTGTYTFSNLAAYQAGTPSTLTQQSGASRFETLYAQPAAFILDIIQVTQRLTVTPGLRYSFQNAIPGTKNGLQPRVSVAYMLDKAHGMVLRSGGGLYIRNVGVNLGQQLARYENAAERSVVISNPCYPNPAAAGCPATTAQPPSLFRYRQGMQSPEQGYFGLSIERQITKGSTVSVGYNGYRGWHALRTIDVNAPLGPYPNPPAANPVRPNPAYSQINTQDSGGYQKSDDLNVSFHGRIRDVFSGFLQYDYQHADANTQWSLFQPENQYDPNNEWARTDYDQRQRLALFGTFYPDKPVTFGVGFFDYTALPYTITDGTDRFDPGLYNARPDGVPRNSLNGGDFQDVQLRLGYTYKFAPLQKQHGDAAEKSVAGLPGSANNQTIAFSISSFNTLNRANFGGYDGVQGSPEFMQPTTANSPRRLQLSAAYNF
jgi:hypothetical protein